VKKISKILNRSIYQKGVKHYLSHLWQKAENDRYSSIQPNLVKDGNLDSKDVDKLLTSIINRKNLKLTNRDICKFYLRCLCCGKGYKGIRDKMRMQKSYNLLRGIDKLKHELDIVKLIRSSRQNQFLANALLNDK